MKIKFLLITILTLLYISAFSQITKITGTIVDSITEEALPFVNIQLIGTKEGTTTDFNGYYKVDSKANFDSIKISYIGYKEERILIKSNSYQEINIKLVSANTELKEVVVIAGENPADIIIKKVIDSKIINSYNNFDSYEYKVYNKLQMDANNISENMKNRRSMKPFKFIFENVDTSTINGKSYLPLFLMENISEIYVRNNPVSKKETVIASKISGIKNESMSQFMGNMYQDVNLYDNYINLFGINFISPIADFSLRTYKYYLIDSLAIDGKWCYQIMFKPRRKQEATFNGTLWIADSCFAIKKVKMKIDEVNVNFIDAMSIDQVYNLIDNKYWMITRDNFVLDFNVIEDSKNLTGFFGHKTTIYNDIIVNNTRPDNDYKSNVAVNINDDAWDKGEEYWDSTRFEDLNEEENKIYTMVDTVLTMPAFQNIYDIIALVTTGYYTTKNFEFGPVGQSYSFNGIEGHRFRIGGRTSNLWSHKIRLYGHLAYGLKDQGLKYGLGSQYIFNKNPRRVIDISYKNDMEQLGASSNAFQVDNIFSSVFSTNLNQSLTMVEEYKSSFMFEYFNGFSNTLTFKHRNIFPFANQSFTIYENTNEPTQLNNIITSEIELSTHFAYKEVFYAEEFNRQSLGTKNPEINMWYSYGIPNLLNSQFEYHKFQIAIKQRFNLFSFGYSTYIISWGKIWGELPYPILEVHPGNETWIYDDYAYNRMSYYEFISDEFFMANYSHNFRGLLFNHIPLLRKLKWREVVYGKLLLGSITDENKEYSKFPNNTSVLSKPYYEAGVGIENIFKILRIDASWRLSYLDKEDVSPFGIMASIRIDF